MIFESKTLLPLLTWRRVIATSQDCIDFEKFYELINLGKPSTDLSRSPTKLRNILYRYLGRVI